MKIRSITCFCNPASEIFQTDLDKLCQVVDHCQAGFEKAGWEVQTARLATTPFGSYTQPKTAVKQIRELEKLAKDKCFTYLSVGPARISHPEEYELIPEILAASEDVFCSGFLTHHHRGISVKAAQGLCQRDRQFGGHQPGWFRQPAFLRDQQCKTLHTFLPGILQLRD